MTYRTVHADVKEMFSSIAGRYDRANSVLSFGIHHLWKRDLIRKLPIPPNGSIVDLCTGTGDLTPLLKKRTTGSVTGIDFCEPMLEIARKRFANSGITFVCADALDLPLPDSSVDIVTTAFGVRNFENLERGLVEIKRVLKPGGAAGILEFGQPNMPVFGTLYRFYSKHLMPHIGAFVTGNRDAYAYLPETAERFPCGREFEQILQRTGFRIRETVAYTFGIAYSYIVEKA